MAASLFKWLTATCLLFTRGDRVSVGENRTADHPLYITVTEINHNPADKSLEISCKIFTNDFEGALQNTFHNHVDLSDPKSKTANDKLVNDYIAMHLKIKVDEKPATLQFVGSEKEKETEATWSYFQAPNVPGVKKIEITDNLLYESFPTQINIIHVTVSGNRKSTKLDNPQSAAVFEF